MMEMPSFRGKHESPENDVYAVCEEQDSIELLITLYMQSSLDVMCYKNSKNSDFLRYWWKQQIESKGQRSRCITPDYV